MGVDYDAIGMIGFVVYDNDIFKKIPIENPEPNYIGCTVHGKNFGDGEYCTHCGEKINIIKTKKHIFEYTKGYKNFAKKEWGCDYFDEKIDEGFNWRGDFAYADIGISFDNDDTFYVGVKLGRVSKYGGGEVLTSLSDLEKTIKKVKQMRDLLLNDEREIHLITGMWIH